MLERLIELVLHAKSGVFAGVILLGATGALVTATVENGVTTITITQASASPSSSASASPSHSASASPTASPSHSPSSSPSSSASAAANAGATTSSCSDEAHTINAAVQQVNSAYSQYHSSLNKLHESTKTDTARTTFATADTLLKGIRQDAVKKIHDTKTCASTADADKADADKDNEDEDKDNDEDKDEHDNKQSSQQNFLVVFLSNLLGRNTTTTTVTATPTATPATTPNGAPSTVTLTGSDPKAIADQAVAAMKVVFDDASKQLASATASPKAHATPRVRTAAPKHGHQDAHESNDD